MYFDAKLEFLAGVSFHSVNPTTKSLVLASELNISYNLFKSQQLHQLLRIGNDHFRLFCFFT